MTKHNTFGGASCARLHTVTNILYIVRYATSKLHCLHMIFTQMTPTSVGISCHHVFVCLSVTSWCSTETAKHRVMQTMPHNSPGTLVYWCWKSWQNSNGIIPNGGAKWRLGRLNGGVVAENWRLLTWSVVNLVRSQVYHTERPPYLSAAYLPWCRASCGFVSNSWSLLVSAMIFAFCPKMQRFLIFLCFSYSIYKNNTFQ